jgi:hypothetical protein
MKVRKYMLVQRAMAITRRREKIVEGEHTETPREERVSRRGTSAMNAKDESLPLAVWLVRNCGRPKTLKRRNSTF